jgi:hypothetical protein
MARWGRPKLLAATAYQFHQGLITDIHAPSFKEIEKEREKHLIMTQSKSLRVPFTEVEIAMLALGVDILGETDDNFKEICYSYPHIFGVEGRERNAASLKHAYQALRRTDLCVLDQSDRDALLAKVGAPGYDRSARGGDAAHHAEWTAAASQKWDAAAAKRNAEALLSNPMGKRLMQGKNVVRMERRALEAAKSSGRRSRSAPPSGGASDAGKGDQCLRCQRPRLVFSRTKVTARYCQKVPPKEREGNDSSDDPRYLCFAQHAKEKTSLRDKLKKRKGLIEALLQNGGNLQCTECDTPWHEYYENAAGKGFSLSFCSISCRTRNNSLKQNKGKVVFKKKPPTQKANSALKKPSAGPRKRKAQCVSSSDEDITDPYAKWEEEDDPEEESDAESEEEPDGEDVRRTMYTRNSLRNVAKTVANSHGTSSGGPYFSMGNPRDEEDDSSGFEDEVALMHEDGSSGVGSDNEHGEAEFGGDAGRGEPIMLD